MGSERGRDPHRLTLWKMVTVARRKQDSRKTKMGREGRRGCAGQWQSPGELAQEPGSDLWYCPKKADIQRVDSSPQRWTGARGGQRAEGKLQASSFSARVPQGWLLFFLVRVGVGWGVGKPGLGGGGRGTRWTLDSVSTAVGCFLPLGSGSRVEAASWF